MKLEGFIERILTLDQLLREGRTGTIEELAEKLQLSQRQTFKYLRAFRNIGRENSFNHKLQSYTYLKDNDRDRTHARQQG